MTQVNNQEVSVLSLTPTATATASSTPSPTRRPTYTPLPTPTITQTPVPVPPREEWDLPYDFLFESSPADCQLPCWQGLEIGRSGAEEIQHMFDTTFGYAGRKDFFAHPLRTSPVVTGVEELGTCCGSEGIAVNLWIDQDTRILRGLRFTWDGYKDTFADLSLERVFREFGPPSDFYIYENPVFVVNYYDLYEFLVVYEELGLAYKFRALLPSIREVDDLDNHPLGFTACFDEESWVLRSFACRRFYIVEPFETDALVITSLQSQIIRFRASKSGKFKLFEEATDTRIMEFVNVAVLPGNPCIDVMFVRDEE